MNLRRPFSALAYLALSLALFAAGAARADSFGLAQVVAKARRLAAQPYQEPPTVPDVLKRLTYDQYRAIEFRKKHALWPHCRFHVQFFMPGLFFEHAVKINVVDREGIHTVPFSAEMFDFGSNKLNASELPRDLGFAGFNLRYTGYHPDRTISKTNEVISVLGASYFRVKGASGQFGVSGRGLAIDTSTHEKFPDFREFWLIKPAPDADQVTFYALMDGASATGAYRFVVHPGAVATTDIKAVVFLRKPVEQIGLAPLSSMYMYGRGDYRPPTYLRPAVHDSQGLLIRTGTGEWIWRPLANPQMPTTYTFQLDDPRGFGLMQRDRNFFIYQSISMNYHVRPSAWIEPLGDWGRGHVVLYEFSTPNETNDNVVAFWEPAEQPAPGKPIRLSYRIHWGAMKPEQHTGRVVDTLMTRRDLKNPTLFVLDFAGNDLKTLAADTKIEGHVSVDDNSKLLYHYIKRNDKINGWRLTFKVAPVTGKPVQLRAYLAHAGHAITETWDYVLAP